MGGALILIRLSDVGSMPLKGRRNEVLEGAKRSQTLTQYTGYGEAFNYVKAFEDLVVSGLARANRPVDLSGERASHSR